jgi:hypothetical protein
MNNDTHFAIETLGLTKRLGDRVAVASDTNWLIKSGYELDGAS